MIIEVYVSKHFDGEEVAEIFINGKLIASDSLEGARIFLEKQKAKSESES